MDKTDVGLGLAGLLHSDGIGLGEAPTTSIAEMFADAPLGVLNSSRTGIGLADLLRAPTAAPARDSSILEAVEKYILWERAAKVDGYDPAVWRKDRFGWWMKFDQYGETSDFGWEKDHIFPLALGGPDILANQAATHHYNNRRKGARFIG